MLLLMFSILVVTITNNTSTCTTINMDNNNKVTVQYNKVSIPWGLGPCVESAWSPHVFGYSGFRCKDVRLAGDSNLTLAVSCQECSFCDCK